MTTTANINFQSFEQNCIGLNIPNFAKLIIENENINNQNKDVFKECFLERYLTDNDYKKLVDGSFLLFYDYKLLGVYKNIPDSYDKNNLLYFKITN